MGCVLVYKAKYWSHAVPSKSGLEFVSGMIHLPDLLGECPSTSLQPRHIGSLLKIKGKMFLRLRELSNECRFKVQDFREEKSKAVITDWTMLFSM